MLTSCISRGAVLTSEFCFFFQAEDGIRDLTVTGVQTCALPICDSIYMQNFLYSVACASATECWGAGYYNTFYGQELFEHWDGNSWKIVSPLNNRSEERRVGKECRSRWSPYH